MVSEQHGSPFPLPSNVPPPPERSPSSAPSTVSLSPSNASFATAVAPPPRRATRGSGLADVHMHDRRFRGMATNIYDIILKPNGLWTHASGKTDNWIFFPGSLTKLNVTEIKRKGTRGVHYVDGWGELGILIEKYDINHYAPASLQDFPAELPAGQRRTLQEIYAQCFPEGAFRALQKARAKKKQDGPSGLQAEVQAGSVDFGSSNQSSSSKRKADNAPVEPSLTTADEGAKEKGKKRKKKNPATTSNSASASSSALSSRGKSASNSAPASSKVPSRTSIHQPARKSTPAEAAIDAALKTMQEQFASIAKTAAEEKEEAVNGACARLQTDIQRLQETNQSQKKNIAQLKRDTDAKDEEIRVLRKEVQSLLREPTRKVAVSGSGEDEDGSAGHSEKLMAELEAQMKADVGHIPNAKWDEIIGNKDAKETLLDLPMCRDPEDNDWYEDECVEESEGILLFGPPGTGKTLFARVLATHGDSNFISVSPDDILNEFAGNSEKRMRGYFNFAKQKAVEKGNTSVLFFDECDRLFGKPGRNDSKVDSNITGIFQECMNGVKEPKGQVVVLAATNFPNRLPSAVLSRFGSKIKVELPSASERVDIIKLQMRKRMKKKRTDMQGKDYSRLAAEIEGASGRDIKNLVINALKVRNFTKNHCQWWCKDMDGYFIPCDHAHKPDCGAEEFTFKTRPRTHKVRPPLLSYDHFAQAIKKFGITPKEQDDQSFDDQDA